MLFDIQEVSTRAVGKRYRLRDVVGHGGMGEVYRAYDRLTGQTVALKRVDIALKQLRFASHLADGDNDNDSLRVALAHEFQTLASLRHPYIISVIDYGFDRRLPYFTMELVANAQTLTSAAADVPIATRLRWIAEILEALIYLHRRGIIHRDLKPANVLIARGEGEPSVKVVDFGLAISRGQTNDTAGTLAYIAPEVLMGEPSSEAGDLYAVGIMLYELLVGHQPFAGAPNLIRSILQTPPAMDALAINPAFKPVLARLLAKRPADRYPNAREALEALAEAAHLTIPESAAIRDSFLQGASFVGRDAEFAQLEDALGETIARRDPYGGAWLIGGESGVGKSRLVEELRVRALVGGALVLRGQATDNSNPYALWRPMLRTLALAADATDDEAALIKKLIPDMDDLLSRPVPDLPPLEPAVLADRLFDAVEAMLGRIEQPFIALFEDLHWASADDLRLFARFATLDKRLPAMWVATFRDDEKPDLPTLLPNLRTMKLQRLGEDYIAALSESMLGEIGRSPQIVQLLNRETEGNAFFIVEVVRALAEEAGQLSFVSTQSMPQHVLAGGVRQVLQRRLDRVPPNARPLLEIAAVMGRALDLAALDAAARRIDAPYPDLEPWLRACADVGVLEVAEEAWRFTHNKLRETMLARHTPNEKAALNRDAAIVLETAHAGALIDYAAPLADHWGAAEDRPKEAYYSLLAGDAAFELNAVVQAVPHYDRALTLADHLDREQLVRLYTRRGRALQIQSRLEESYANYEAMGAAGERLDDDRLRLGALSGRSLLHTLFSPIYDPLRAVEVANQGVVLARAIGDRAAEARLLWNHMIAYNFRGEYALGLPFGESAVRIARELHQQETLAYALNDIMRSYRGTGRLNEALTVLQEATAMWRAADHRPMLADSLSGISMIHHLRGDYTASLAAADEADRASQPHNLWGSIYSLLGKGYSLIEQGHVDMAISAFRHMLEMSAPSQMVVADVFAYIGLALTHGFCGDGDSAHRFAQQSRATVETYHLAPVFSAYADAVGAYMAAYNEDWETARAWIADVRDDLRDFNSPTSVFAHLARAELALSHDDASEARRGMDDLITALRDAAHETFLPDALALRARALLRLNQADTARADADASREIAARTKARRAELVAISAQVLTASTPEQKAAYQAEGSALMQSLADAVPPALRDRFLEMPPVRRFKG